LKFSLVSHPDGFHTLQLRNNEPIESLNVSLKMK
jgi:hypothetical protein